MRIAIVATAVSLALVGLSAADEAAAAIRKPTNIPAQHLGTALQTLAKERGLQVVYLSDQVDTLRTPGATGVFTPDEVLARLLSGTGLSFRYLDDETVTVFRTTDSADYGDAQRTEVRAPVAPVAAPTPKQSFWDRFRISQEGFMPTSMRLASAAQEASAEEASQERRPEPLEEVIVTATKREMDIRKVAGSVSAMTERDLKDLGAQSLADYITRIPGVVFNDYQPGVSEVVIRGIASSTYHENNQTTVGYYLNEVPLTEFSFPVVIPDIDTFDLERVEVLRGPQGTLFGSSSLGGLVNYVVHEADASDYDFGLETSLAGTRNAGEESYGIKGMFNAPIVSDKLAVRVVGLQRFDAGFLDAPRRDAEGTNDLTVKGLRASLVYTPSEATRISYLGMYQEYALEDQTYTITPNLDRNTVVPEPTDQSVTIHSARIEHDFSAATLSAIGSHSRKRGAPTFDYTAFYAPGQWAGTPFVAFGDAESELDTLELRLASNGEGRFGWLVGANYTENDRSGSDVQYQEGVSDYIDANPDLFGGVPGSVLAPGDLFERVVSSGNTKEQALFGEASMKLDDRWTVTAGGRFFEVTSDVRLQLLENINLIPPFDYVPGADEESGFTPKVSLQFQANQDLMAYLLYSEGFRVGGVNVYSAANPAAPLSFDSDTDTNYEFGVRSRLLGGAATLDVSIYHIDWDDIQVRLFTPDFLAYTTNGGGAKVDGVEIAGDFNLSRYVNFATAVSYNDARLAELLPDSFAPGGGHAEGTTLPGSSEWTFANSLTLRLGDLRFNPVISLNHRYLSKAPVGFGTIIERGGYHLADLRLSIDVSDKMEVALFAKNLFDEYGILNAPFGDIEGAGSVVRPRTVGATVRWNFR